MNPSEISKSNKWNIINQFNEAVLNTCSIMFINDNLDKINPFIYNKCLKDNINNFTINVVKCLDNFAKSIGEDPRNFKYRKYLNSEDLNIVKDVIHFRNKRAAHYDQDYDLSNLELFNVDNIMINEGILLLKDCLDMIYNDIIKPLNTKYTYKLYSFDSLLYRYVYKINNTEEENIRTKIKEQFNLLTQEREPEIKIDKAQIIATCYNGIILDEKILNRQKFCIEFNKHPSTVSDKEIWVEIDQDNQRIIDLFEKLNIIDKHEIIDSVKFNKYIDDCVLKHNCSKHNLFCGNNCPFYLSKSCKGNLKILKENN